jgi:hypothetical protein
MKSLRNVFKYPFTIAIPSFISLFKSAGYSAQIDKSLFAKITGFFNKK